MGVPLSSSFSIPDSSFHPKPISPANLSDLEAKASNYSALRILAAGYTGTAFHLGNGLLITARHVIGKFDNEAEWAERPELFDEGDIKGFCLRLGLSWESKNDCQEFTKDNISWIWYAKHRDTDIAIIHTKGIENRLPAPIPMLKEIPEALLRRNLEVMGFGNDDDTLSRTRIVYERKDYRQGELLIDSLVENGAPAGCSGGPVILWGSKGPYIAGMATHGGRPLDRSVLQSRVFWADALWKEIAEATKIEISRKVVDDKALALPIGVAGWSLWADDFMELPVAYVRRTDLLGQLSSLILSGKPGGSVVLKGLFGIGGVGKTLLAAAVSQDFEIKQHFRDGIFWLTLGEAASSKDALLALAAKLPGFKTEKVDEAKAWIRDSFRGRKILVICDDVWHGYQLQDIQDAKAECLLLITTRDRGAFQWEPDSVLNVDAFTEAEALTLLGQSISIPTSQLKPLAVQVKYYPLAISLLHSQLLVRTKAGEHPQEVIDNLLGQLQEVGVTFIQGPSQDERFESSAKCLRLSLKYVRNRDISDSREVECLLSLGAFPEDAEIPTDVVFGLWNVSHGLGPNAVMGFLLRFESLHFVRLNSSRTHISLHDIVRQFFAHELGDDLVQAHAHISTVLKDWVPTLKTDQDSTIEGESLYRWKYLPYHLKHANQIEALKHLLLDYTWLVGKTECMGAHAASEDFLLIEDNPGIVAIRDALVLSHFELTQDAHQLASQLHGRISEDDSPEAALLLDSARCKEKQPWLQSHRPMLERPGGALKWILRGHSRNVNHVAIWGEKAVSASSDCTLCVWDLSNGKKEQILTGHTNRVNHVAIWGNKAVSASEDMTIRVWDLKSGTTECVLNVGRPVYFVALWGDMVVSVSWSLELEVWNLKSGKVERALKHELPPTHVAIWEDKAISSCCDDRLRIWDLHTGKIERVLELKYDVQFVSIWGNNAVCYSLGNWVTVLNLNTGENEKVLNWVYGLIDSAAIWSDKVVLATRDDTLTVWDLRTGEIEGVLEGKARGVSSITILGDLAISACCDATIRAWDLRARRVRQVKEEKSNRINVVAVWGEKAISTTGHEALQVLNLNSGKLDRYLVEQYGSINHFAIWGDKAITSSRSSLHVWDLRSAKSEMLLDPLPYFPINQVAVWDDKVISLSGSDSLMMWYLRNGRKVRYLEKIKPWVKRLRIWNKKVGLFCSYHDRLVLNLKRDYLDSTMSGHFDIVNSIATWGDKCVTASKDCTLGVWDLKTGKLTRFLKGHGGSVKHVSIWGDKAVSASSDHTLRIWNLFTGKEERVLHGHKDSVNYAAISGNKVVSASEDYTLRVWELNTGLDQVIFRGTSAFTSCAVSNNFTCIVAGDAEGKVHIFTPRNFNQGV